MGSRAACASGGGPGCFANPDAGPRPRAWRRKAKQNPMPQGAAAENPPGGWRAMARRPRETSLADARTFFPSRRCAARRPSVLALRPTLERIGRHACAQRGGTLARANGSETPSSSRSTRATGLKNLGQLPLQARQGFPRTNSGRRA